VAACEVEFGASDGKVVSGGLVVVVVLVEVAEEGEGPEQGVEGEGAAGGGVEFQGAQATLAVGLHCCRGAIAHLGWPQRMRIAIAIASAIAETPPPSLRSAEQVSRPAALHSHSHSLTLTLNNESATTTTEVLTEVTDVMTEVDGG
jgi:hypothetical protein